MTYSIVVSNSVEQQLDDLPEKLRLLVLTAIAELADTPRPNGITWIATL